MEDKKLEVRLGTGKVDKLNGLLTQAIFIMGVIAVIMYIGILLLTGGLL